MTYQITLRKRAIKALARINEPHYSQIKQSIYGLAKNPRPLGYKKLKDRNGYRIRIGDYRVIYEIYKKSLKVDVITLGHRKDIYN